MAISVVNQFQIAYTTPKRNLPLISKSGHNFLKMSTLERERSLGKESNGGIYRLATADKGPFFISQQWKIHCTQTFVISSI